MDIDEIKNRVTYNPETGEFFHSGLAPKHLLGKRCGTVSNYNSGIKYILIKVNYKQYLAHRVAYTLCNGSIPRGMEIDHINRNGLDNRISNLRAVTRSDNLKNRNLIWKKRRSGRGLTGVNFEKFSGRYKAVISYNGKQINLGRSDDFFEACCLRKSAEAKFGYI